MNLNSSTINNQKRKRKKRNKNRSKNKRAVNKTQAHMPQNKYLNKPQLRMKSLFNNNLILYELYFFINLFVILNKLANPELLNY